MNTTDHEPEPRLSAADQFTVKMALLDGLNWLHAIAYSDRELPQDNASIAERARITRKAALDCAEAIHIVNRHWVYPDQGILSLAADSAVDFAHLDDERGKPFRYGQYDYCQWQNELDTLTDDLFKVLLVVEEAPLVELTMNHQWWLNLREKMAEPVRKASWAPSADTYPWPDQTKEG